MAISPVQFSAAQATRHSKSAAPKFQAQLTTEQQTHGISAFYTQEPKTKAGRIFNDAAGFIGKYVIISQAAAFVVAALGWTAMRLVK